MSKWSENRDSNTHADTYVHSCIIHNRQENWRDTSGQAKCPSRDKSMNKMWFTHTKEYYSALKRKTMPLFATTRINLNDLTLRTDIVGFPLFEVSGVSKLIQAASRMVAAGTWGQEGEWGCSANGDSVSVCADARVLELDLYGWLHNSVNGLNWLKRSIFCYVYFTTITKNH